MPAKVYTIEAMSSKQAFDQLLQQLEQEGHDGRDIMEAFKNATSERLSMCAHYTNAHFVYSHILSKIKK
jgi:hypothetical protein